VSASAQHSPVGNAKRAGNPEIAKFFRDVRMLSATADPDGKTYPFAEKVLKMTGQALDRIEKGQRLPGPDVMVRILHEARKHAGLEPRRLLYLWLEAMGMKDWIDEIARGRR
jgi:hypothetical protein